MAELLPDLPNDDETHPIAHLDKIDVAIRGKNADFYGIAIDEPLVDDKLTRARLLKKLDNYLNDLYSESAIERRGAPSPQRESLNSWNPVAHGCWTTA